MIRVEQVVKTYDLGETKVEALRGVSLEVREGEFVAIAGASGSGKSTLLNIIGTIERPSAGHVFLDDLKLDDLNADQAATFRSRHLGFIFQTFNLLPVLTAYENVEYPLLLHGVAKGDRHARVSQILKEVGLNSHQHHLPAQLSGGQRQRVAIARALVGKPTLVLADEPTANLDHQTGTEIMELMKNLSALRGTTFIFSTHDPQVMTAASRVIRLTDGQFDSA